MERLVHGDYVCLALFLGTSILSYQLESSFVGLGTTIAEEDTFHTTQFDQSLGSFDRVGIPVKIRAVEHAVFDDLLQLSTQLRIAISEYVYRYTCHHIQIPIPFSIVDVSPFAFHQH